MPNDIPPPLVDAVARLLPQNAVWVTSGLKRAKQTAAAIHAPTYGMKRMRAAKAPHNIAFGTPIK